MPQEIITVQMTSIGGEGEAHSSFSTAGIEMPAAPEYDIKTDMPQSWNKRDSNDEPLK